MKNYKIASVSILFFILNIGLFNACNTTEPINKIKLGSSENIYFPLNIGNKWYYNSYHINDPNFDSTKFDRTWEVISSKCLGRKLFYQIESVIYNNDGTIFKVDSLYYAISADSLFLIDTGQPFNETSLKLMALFNSEQYQSFIVKSDSSGDYIGYLIDKTDSTNSFYYYRDGWNDSGWQMTFKKKVGYIESHSEWGFGSKLVSYILK